MSPSRSTRVPVPVPMTAGMPYSRATIAACDASPPVSTTTAAARSNSGVHDGFVYGQTSTSPGRSDAKSAGLEHDPHRPGCPPSPGGRARDERVASRDRDADRASPAR